MERVSACCSESGLKGLLICIISDIGEGLGVGHNTAHEAKSYKIPLTNLFSMVPLLLLLGHTPAFSPLLRNADPQLIHNGKKYYTVRNVLVSYLWLSVAFPAYSFSIDWEALAPGVAHTYHKALNLSTNIRSEAT